MKNVNVVFKLATGSDQRNLAEEILSVFNSWARVGAEYKTAELIGSCLTPVYGQYTTGLFNPVAADIIEQAGDLLTTAEVIRAEWPQEADEETGIVPEYPAITYDVWDADGVVTRQPIGVI